MLKSSRPARPHALLITTLTLLVATTSAYAQLTPQDIMELRDRGRDTGWTFDVGENDATQYPLEQLCGAVEPDGWAEEAPIAPPLTHVRDLPAAFDWRDVTGCPPIRNQGGCGSCWAFSAIGAMECKILIEQEHVVDLSEQWLVSCTNAGDCDGGWHTSAANYLMCSGSSTDPCGDQGAVMEGEFPYIANNGSCNCPYSHPYCLDSWSSLGYGVASVENIKQAIYQYGPVGTCVRVNSAFHAYNGGVFNGCESGSINHAVVLVGWDDTQGTNGVWIMRNSWGTGWGEQGYMRINYGCSSVGYATMWVNYTPPMDDCNLNGVPDADDIADGTSADCNTNGVPDECENDAHEGLVGTYYADMNLSVPYASRIDETIDFNWGNGEPWPGIGTDTFSARWTGTLHTPNTAGWYDFFTTTDDGVRLWVNGQLIIDAWIDQSPTEHSGTIALAANSEYPIVMEYYENSGGAVAELRWQPPGQSKVIIPANNLTAGRDCNGNGVPDACDILDGTSSDADGNGMPDECELGLDVDSVAPINGQSVSVLFTVPVEQTSAETTSHYVIDGDIDVLSATLADDLTTVTLTTTPLAAGTTYTLTINDITDLRVPPRTIAPDTQATFEVAAWNRVQGGLVALYTFDEGEGLIAHDVSEFGTPLDLTIDDDTATTWLDGGLELHSATRVRSGTATKIVDACRASDELTLEAWVAPANLTQTGPARIAAVSYTGSSYNFTLGQDADRYAAQIRTSTDPVELLTPSETVQPGLQHVVLTRDVGGLTQLYLDGVTVAAVTQPGNFATWNSGYRVGVGNDIISPLPWLGAVRLVAVYDRALGTPEINQNFAAGPDEPVADLTGDTNCDGQVDYFDIQYFLEALDGEAQWPYPDCPWLNADCNDDHTVDYMDINAFLDVLGS